ncbi:MAG: hypothetical protein WC655_27370 [Candidatus Hydrogenedentales bacterium]|jgi:phosphoribosylaminoimidazolecarboxamide formyltransferase/IMP cyclohydrolase
MAMDNLKDMYRTRTVGDFPESFEALGRRYDKIEDLRYGTNPHQPAAFYRPANGEKLVLGAYEILKTGKSGLSQTNIEDMHHAIGILKFLTRPACAVMKHCNPSGVAVQVDTMPLVEVYQRARDADAQAAFGGTVVFNRTVDADTASEIMQSIVEGVAAPAFEPAALEALNNFEKFRRNKEMRIIKVPDFSSLPKYTGDGVNAFEMRCSMTAASCWRRRTCRGFAAWTISLPRIATTRSMGVSTSPARRAPANWTTSCSRGT